MGAGFISSARRDVRFAITGMFSILCFLFISAVASANDKEINQFNDTEFDRAGWKSSGSFFEAPNPSTPKDGGFLRFLFPSSQEARVENYKDNRVGWKIHVGGHFDAKKEENGKIKISFEILNETDASGN